jgi:hypothetical protein
VNADPLLEAMNARRNIAAGQEQRNYLEHFADFSGLIKKPVLTVHPFVDAVAPVTSESAYRNTIAAAGRSDLLVQVYTNTIGHGSATTDQLVAAVQALDEWVRTGTRPAPSAFPAALGFIPDFVPPLWNQPEVSMTAVEPARGTHAAVTAFNRSCSLRSWSQDRGWPAFECR